MADKTASPVCEVCHETWDESLEGEADPTTCEKCLRVFMPCCNSLMDDEVCEECAS
ncbi:hypothetical protein LCGC14_1935560 [marine sediment metagenome]|uniref:Uncharacterized protein n=1 Tax=marine sediment metagenome TaxID=412755 RepID=A0A0F9FM73_9ZZZZ